MKYYRMFEEVGAVEAGILEHRLGLDMDHLEGESG